MCLKQAVGPSIYAWARLPWAVPICAQKPVFTSPPVAAVLTGLTHL